MKAIVGKCLLISALGLGLNACSATLNARPDDPAFSPVYPPPVTTSPDVTGSIYQANPHMNLFRDRRAHQVGDIITVLLIENTQSKKQANTNTERKSTAAIPAPTLFGQGIKQAAFSTENDTKLQGTANSNQSNNLTGTITVSVYRVLSNGNLMVRGEKWVTLNQGDEYIRLSGIIRPEDIDANNQVESGRIANPRISYSGTGALAETNNPGWMSRIFGGALNGAFPF